MEGFQINILDVPFESQYRYARKCGNSREFAEIVSARKHWNVSLLFSLKITFLFSPNFGLLFVFLYTTNNRY